MDISKCDGIGCQIKDWCIRFTAPASDRQQSWIAPSPRGYDCDHFLHNATPSNDELKRMAKARKDTK